MHETKEKRSVDFYCDFIRFIIYFLSNEQYCIIFLCLHKIIFSINNFSVGLFARKHELQAPQLFSSLEIQFASKPNIASNSSNNMQVLNPASSTLWEALVVYSTIYITRMCRLHSVVLMSHDWSWQGKNFNLIFENSIYISHIKIVHTSERSKILV